MYRRVVCCTDNLTHKSVSIPEEERKYVKGNFPHIVSEELWEKCRRRRVSCGPRKQGPAAQTYGNAGTAQGDKWACRLSCSRRTGMYRQLRYGCRRANLQTGAEKNQTGEGTAIKPSGTTAGTGQGGCSPGETPSQLKSRPGILGAFVPEAFAMPLKGQCILDHIVQLARVKLARSTAVSQVGGKAAGSGHIRGKADLLALSGLKTQGQNAEGGIGACFGGGQLLADSAVDVHDFHLLFLNCYTICTGKD